jgi:hypothetical protein
MPRLYSTTVHRQFVSLLRSGEAVGAVADEARICQATLGCSRAGGSRVN